MVGFLSRDDLYRDWLSQDLLSRVIHLLDLIIHSLDPFQSLDFS